MKTELHKAEIAIAYVLRYGVLLSAFVIALGFVLSLTKQGLVTHDSLHELMSGKALSQKYEAPVSVAQFKEGIANLDPTVIVSLGLVLLIGLPVLRVAMTVVFFLLERDYLYFVITLIVLSVLLSGIFLGKVL